MCLGANIKNFWCKRGALPRPYYYFSFFIVF